MNDWKDRELGMDRGITRRDFLNGVALTVGAAILPSDLFSAADIPPGAEKSLSYYPPALTGLRGSHPGSFEVAHSLRDGTFWEQAGKPVDTGEKYDLVIVGGGISGLSAAHFFRKVAGPKARLVTQLRSYHRMSYVPVTHRTCLTGEAFHRVCRNGHQAQQQCGRAGYDGSRHAGSADLEILTRRSGAGLGEVICAGHLQHGVRSPQ